MTDWNKLWKTMRRVFKRHRYLSLGGLVIICGLTVCLAGLFYRIPLDGQAFNRPSAGDMEEIYSFNARDENGREDHIELHLSPRVYSEEEARKRMGACYQKLRERILGYDSGKGEKDVHGIGLEIDMSLVEGFEEFAWSMYSSEPDLIGSDGRVHYELMEEDRRQVVLMIRIRYEAYEENYELPVELVNDGELYEKSLNEYLQDEERDSCQEESFVLPEVIKGKHYRYYKNVDMSGIFAVMCLILSMILLIWYRGIALEKEQEKEKRLELEQMYPALISKLLIYMKAGLSVRKTWEKVEKDFRADKHLGKALSDSLYELQMGIGEKDVYLNFGRRCGLQSYLRLGSLLEQNLRKGSYSLAGLLESERVQALEHRKQEIRSSGELAGTKLLLPMMVLFGLVLVIIMVPSLMALNY